MSLSNGALQSLMEHSWPGNVRELENCIERAAIMTEGDVVDAEAISASGIQIEPFNEHKKVEPAQPITADLNDQNMSERERVINALEQAGWVKAKAARLLGMTPRQIAYRIQTLNIDVRRI